MKWGQKKEIRDAHGSQTPWPQLGSGGREWSLLGYFIIWGPTALGCYSPCPYLQSALSSLK